jgi:Fe-S-cluster containining protein
VRKLKVLPSMQCDEGCGACCGIVPVTETEFGRVGRYIKQHGIEPRAHENLSQCPLYIDGKCSVYPVRPLICQMFGHAEDLPCARGYNVNVPQAQVDRMIRGNGRPTRLLHELIPGLKERFEADRALKVLMDQALGGAP